MSDRGEMVDVDSVPLAQGPLLVEALRQEGVAAVGIESFDVVTGSTSRMRILVREGDRAAAALVLDRLRTRGTDTVGSASAEEQPDPDTEAADEAAQAAMGDLYLAADRVAHAPWDVLLVEQVGTLGSRLAGTEPPFGVERAVWREAVSLAAAVVEADEVGAEEQVRHRAAALRDLLRDLV